MDKKIRDTLLLIFFTVVVCALIMAYYNTTKKNSIMNSKHSYRMNAHWEIGLDGHQYDDADLDLIVPKQRKDRSVMSMETTIPKMVTLKNPVLKIYTVNAGYEVYCDRNTLIGYYGIRNVATHTLVGSGYSYINLPDDYAGKTLRIRLYVNEDNAFTSIVPPEIWDANYMIRDYIKHNMIPFVINLFLLVFGIVVFPLSVIYALKVRKFLSLSFAGLFSFFISIWSICDYDLITLFAYNLLDKVYLQYGSMCLWSVFVLLYFSDYIIDSPRWMKHLFWTTFAVQIIYMFVSFGLQCLNKMHIPDLLPGEHAVVLMVCLNMIIDVVYAIFKRKHKNQIIVVGLVVFTCITVTDVVRFNLEKYVFTDQVFNYVSLMCVGAFVFVFTQIIDFCQDISEIMSKEMRKSALREMAYKDSLTQIGNRRKCDEVLADLDERGKTFGMICFDLNNLKKVNDIEGHEKGDLLIRSFAEVLSKTFEEYGIVCRMGGDEFTVILPDMGKIDTDKLFEKLQDNISKKNEEIPGLNISTAYGFSHNCLHSDWTSNDIYRDADQKMYDNKMAMKAGR